MEQDKIARYGGELYDALVARAPSPSPATEMFEAHCTSFDHLVRARSQR